MIDFIMAAVVCLACLYIIKRAIERKKGDEGLIFEETPYGRIVFGYEKSDGTIHMYNQFKYSTPIEFKELPRRSKFDMTETYENYIQPHSRMYKEGGIEILQLVNCKPNEPNVLECKDKMINEI